ncbi:sirohydrochlorin cobaltochelatase [Collinsella tanakaei]|uniref:sirohydrochlorin cobaltochelatase n=1 Tax=Collinsella tanakaei TaxID=626935 RepID=UPI0025A39919|nr:sirohydrochlorin cobaltochelatase [Collinsella tanakaei]MDM8245744.1 sirohydrochlorin cobaltochelatase [Collinsella tanakaei]
MTHQQMSRRALVGAAGTGAIMAAAALAGCSNETASSGSAEVTPAETKPVILVVSFGTSYNSSRHITIGAIEDAIREKYGHDYDVRRAFSADTIIDILKERDGIEIDNVETALDRCVADGIKTLVVQPTHLMDGYEYTDLADALDEYADKFDAVSLGAPLLDTPEDFEAVADALAEELTSYDDGQTALVFMGHGTEHEANADYATMQDTFASKGMSNYFVGTVEAEPTCDDVIAAVQAAGLTRAVLSPLMVVAGDHATNDMADTQDPESWASKFAAAGIDTTCLLVGLGQYAAIDDIYVSHADAAIEAL